MGIWKSNQDDTSGKSKKQKRTKSVNDASQNRRLKKYITGQKTDRRDGNRGTR